MTSPSLKKYLSDIQYGAGGVSSQLEALKYFFSGTKPVLDPSLDEWAGIGSILENVFEEAKKVQHALDSVNLPGDE